jgi:hypothetical protein
MDVLTDLQADQDDSAGRTRGHRERDKHPSDLSSHGLIVDHLTPGLFRPKAKPPTKARALRSTRRPMVAVFC